MHARIHHGGRHVDVTNGKRMRRHRSYGFSSVDGGILLPVLHCLSAVLHLGGQGAHVPLAHRVELALRRPNVQTATAAVVADAIHVIHDHSAVVDVGDVGRVDVID
jgi:hypothetical protein